MSALKIWSCYQNCSQQYGQSPNGFAHSVFACALSKSHVMGLTTDIDVVHRKKKFKAVVDMSEPISIQVENQTDIDILTKLDLLDDEDTNKVLDFINNLLTIKKYEGIEDSPIEYVTK